ATPATTRSRSRRARRLRRGRRPGAARDQRRRLVRFTVGPQWVKVGRNGREWPMLLGQHEHALDDKNRLTLPARLREQLGDRVVVTRGLDGCLYVYAADAWTKLANRVGTPDP